MRLIDADKLKINLYHNKKVVLNDDLVKCIDDTETAYDVDKVMNKLEENSSNFSKSYKVGNNTKYHKGYKAIKLNKAIEIVKAGGK